MDDFIEINARGTQNVMRGALDARRAARRPRVVEQPVRRQRPPHRHVPQRRAVRPVLRLRALEDAGRAARARRRRRRTRRRHRAPAVVLRPVPAAAPDDVLPHGSHRQVPGHRRRSPAPLDGPRRQPRAGHRARRADAHRRPAAGWWIADAEPYEVNDIVATVGRALRAEGFDVVPNKVRLPAIAGRVAERVDALHPAPRALRAAGPRARRDGQDDRLRHLGRPRRARLRADRRPRGGHAPEHPLVPRRRGSSCDDDEPRHRRQRLLRPARRRPPRRPRRRRPAARHRRHRRRAARRRA